MAFLNKEMVLLSQKKKKEEDKGIVRNLSLGGQDKTIILICNSRKIQNMTFIHIYMSWRISLEKQTLNPK